MHVRVAVHIAADPGSEAQNGRQLERVRRHAIEFLQRLRDLVVERRHDAIQDLDEIEEDVFAFIGDCQLLARVILGLPRSRKLGAQPPCDAAYFVRGKRRIQPIKQQLRDALLLAQHRAARRLGRMRHEHRLNA